MKSLGALSGWLAAAAIMLGTMTATHAAEPTPPRSTLTQPRTGTTNTFGSGTLTNRTDGSSSRTQPFGSGSITTERTKDGRTITGHTQKFGSGTITNRSDGSTSRSQPFGSGTLRTDQPGRKSR